MAKQELVVSMVDMVTALVIFIHNTNMVVARTRSSNRRTHWMAKLRTQRLTSSTLEIRITSRRWSTGSHFKWWPAQVWFFHLGKPIARQFHQISRTDICECRARDVENRQYTLSHAHFSQFSQSSWCVALYMTFFHLHTCARGSRTDCMNVYSKVISSRHVS